MSLPDPNMDDGPIRLRQRRGDWADEPYRSRGAREGRGIGLQDMAEAIAASRTPRACGALAYHVVEVGRSILAAAESGEAVVIASEARRPDPLPVAALAQTSGRSA